MTNERHRGTKERFTGSKLPSGNADSCAGFLTLTSPLFPINTYDCRRARYNSSETLKDYGFAIFHKVGEPSDGDCVLKARILARYTFPKNKLWHLELIADKSIATKNVPEEVSASLLVRYNFKP